MPQHLRGTLDGGNDTHIDVQEFMAPSFAQLRVTLGSARQARELQGELVEAGSLRSSQQDAEKVT